MSFETLWDALGRNQIQAQTSRRINPRAMSGNIGPAGPELPKTGGEGSYGRQGLLQSMRFRALNDEMEQARSSWQREQGRHSNYPGMQTPAQGMVRASDNRIRQTWEQQQEQARSSWQREQARHSNYSGMQTPAAASTDLARERARGVQYPMPGYLIPTPATISGGETRTAGNYSRTPSMQTPAQGMVRASDNRIAENYPSEQAPTVTVTDLARERARGVQHPMQHYKTPAELAYQSKQPTFRMAQQAHSNYPGLSLPLPEHAPYGQSMDKGVPYLGVNEDGQQAVMTNYAPGTAPRMETPGYRNGVKVDAAGQPVIDHDQRPLARGNIPSAQGGSLAREPYRDYPLGESERAGYSAAMAKYRP